MSTPIKNVLLKKRRMAGGVEITAGMEFRLQNGQHVFSITGTTHRHGREESAGCIHAQIADAFPELAHLIKWHLCSTGGPMYYFENTLYHAGEIPKEQGKWFFYLENTLIKIVDADERATMTGKYGHNARFEPYHNPMAKEPDLQAARATAIWPDATLEQLRDMEALQKHLPDVLADFRKAMMTIGFME